MSFTPSGQANKLLEFSLERLVIAITTLMVPSKIPHITITMSYKHCNNAVSMPLNKKMHQYGLA